MVGKALQKNKQTKQTDNFEPVVLSEFQAAVDTARIRADPCRVDALPDEMDKAARQGAGLAGTRPRQGQLN